VSLGKATGALDEVAANVFAAGVEVPGVQQHRWTVEALRVAANPVLEGLRCVAAERQDRDTERDEPRFQLGTKRVLLDPADLLNLQVDLILFDTTSTYFEIPAEREDELRKFGESKDKRWDLPQVVVGFAVTKEGIPVRCFTYPGNASD
jgi:hypothetical protein